MPARSDLEPCALSLEWAVHCAEIWAALPATSNCPADKTEAVADVLWTRSTARTTQMNITFGFEMKRRRVRFATLL